MVKCVVPCPSSLELGNYLRIFPIQSMEGFLMSFSFFFFFVRSHVFLCVLSHGCLCFMHTLSGAESNQINIPGIALTRESLALSEG